MVGELFLGALGGVASGVRHAVEPDHLAAVSTFASEHRDRRGAMRLAAAWGAGHALTLLALGGGLLLTRRQLPGPLLDVFELVVAAALVALGLRALLRGRAASAAPASLRRPLLFGLLHGLAGSGPLAAWVIASVGAGALGLLYMALYGTGALVGMAALAGLFGGPLTRLARSPRFHTHVVRLAGVLSLACGVWWGAEAFSRLAS